MKFQYFDFGLYKGVELSWMINQTFPSLQIENYEVHGFEACKQFYNSLENKFKSNNKVNIHHLAISDKEGEINLYHSPNQVGHSIFDSKNNVNKDVSEIVKSSRFSVWLKENNIQLEGNFNILKVNIEGAEWHLFNDLVDNDLVKHFDIFCGQGHDVQKVGELKDKVNDYHKLLNDNSIDILRFSEYKPSKNINMVKVIEEKMR